MRHLEPIELAELLKQVRGHWVALLDGEIVAARPTMDAVVAELEEKGQRQALVMRAPGEHDAELVGLG